MNNILPTFGVVYKSFFFFINEIKNLLFLALQSRGVPTQHLRLVSIIATCLHCWLQVCTKSPFTVAQFPPSSFHQFMKVINNTWDPPVALCCRKEIIINWWLPLQGVRPRMHAGLCVHVKLL